MMIPGVALAESMIPTATPDEVLTMSFGFMVAAGGLLSLLHELPNASLGIEVATILLLVFSLWRFMHSKLIAKVSSADKFGLYCMLASFVLALSAVLLPVNDGDVLFLFAQPWHTRMPFLPGDMVLPFRFTQFLVNHLDVSTTTFYCCGWQIYDRTPLMGMVGGYLLGLFRINVSGYPIWGMTQPQVNTSGFYEFWVAGTLLNASVIFSGYLLIKTIFHQKAARLATIFLVLNPFILWNSFYTSPKSMAAYFVLLFYYCVVTRRHLPVAGLFAGLAVLSHPYVLVYIVGGMLFLIPSHVGEIKRDLRRISIMVALLVAVVTPWGLWAYGLHSDFGLFWRMQAGPSDLTSMVWTRIVNLYQTLAPYYFGYLPSYTSSFFAESALLNAEARSHPILTLLGATYIWTLPGATSLSLATFSYTSLVDKFRSMGRPILFFIVVPLILSLAITGHILAGLTPYYLHPIVVMLVAFGALYLLEQGSRPLIALVSFGIVAESLFLTWVLVYPFYLILRLSSVFDFALFALILLCYFAVLITLAHILLEGGRSKRGRRSSQSRTPALCSSLHFNAAYLND